MPRSSNRTRIGPESGRLLLTGVGELGLWPSGVPFGSPGELVGSPGLISGSLFGPPGVPEVISGGIFGPPGGLLGTTLT